MVKVNQELCIGCGLCAADCLAFNIQVNGEKAEVKGECLECGHCVAVCPANAVSIEGYDMEDMEEYDEETFKVDPENLLRAIKFRRSIRFYKDEKVTEKDLHMLAQAGRYTATAKNNQDCHFVFVQEERAGDIAGCRGARACDLSFFSDVKFVLECDRKGSSDVVFIGKGDTQLCEQDFIPQQLLNKYGYEMVKGGKTDVVELKMRGLQIPVCNISCGYYDAHKNSEYTLFPELQNCLSFVRGVLKSI